MITGLGAALTGDPDLLTAFRASLDTLGSHQSSLGLIPLNVLPETGEVSTENAGAVDANLWFILGHYYHFLHTRDLAYLQANWPRIERAVLWLRYQDMNECGLLEVPEAGDWMDLLAVRYNVLYDNVLYGAALRAAGDMAAITGHVPDVAPSAAADVFERLNLLLWVDRCWVASHFAEHLEKLKALRLEWYMLYHNVGTISSRPFYLPYVAFREYGDYCDTLGNLLAVLCGLADEHRADQILRYLYQVGAAQPSSRRRRSTRRSSPATPTGASITAAATSTCRTSTTTAASGPSSAVSTSRRWSSWAGSRRPRISWAIWLPPTSLGFMPSGSSTNGCTARPAIRWATPIRPGQPGCTCTLTTLSRAVKPRFSMR